jgi:phage terminase large subunit GpA-like protein
VQLRPRNEALDCMNYNLAAVRLAPLLIGRAVSRAGTLGAAPPAPAPEPDRDETQAAAAPAAESPAATLARIQRMRAQRRR